MLAPFSASELIGVFPSGLPSLDEVTFAVSQQTVPGRNRAENAAHALAVLCGQRFGVDEDRDGYTEDWLSLSTVLADRQSRGHCFHRTAMATGASLMLDGLVAFPCIESYLCYPNKSAAPKINTHAYNAIPHNRTLTIRLDNFFKKIKVSAVIAYGPQRSLTALMSKHPSSLSREGVVQLRADYNGKTDLLLDEDAAAPAEPETARIDTFFFGEPGIRTFLDIIEHKAARREKRNPMYVGDTKLPRIGIKGILEAA